MPDYSYHTVCIATPIAEPLNECFTLRANVAKCTNDLLFCMNRFHSDVYFLCLSLILMLERIKRRHIF